MGHALDRVRLPVGEVVGGIDAPGITGARVRRVEDAIQHRVAHVDVARRHVDPGAQHPGAVGEFPGAHAAEQIQVLLRRPVAMRAVAAGLGQGAAVGADLVGGQVVDIRLAGPDQVFGPIVKPLEIIGGEVEMLAPVEAEPADVPLDGLDVLQLLLDGVGVVEAQVAAAAELPGDAEIQADRLGVADMEVPVGLRRKAGDHGPDAAGGHVGADDVADVVPAAFPDRGPGIAHTVAPGAGTTAAIIPGKPTTRPSPQ